MHRNPPTASRISHHIGISKLEIEWLEIWSSSFTCFTCRHHPEEAGKLHFYGLYHDHHDHHGHHGHCHHNHDPGRRIFQVCGHDHCVLVDLVVHVQVDQVDQVDIDLHGSFLLVCHNCHVNFGSRILARVALLYIDQFGSALSVDIYLFHPSLVLFLDQSLNLNWVPGHNQTQSNTTKLNRDLEKEKRKEHRDFEAFEGTLNRTWSLGIPLFVAHSWHSQHHHVHESVLGFGCLPSQEEKEQQQQRPQQKTQQSDGFIQMGVIKIWCLWKLPLYLTSHPLSQRWASITSVNRATGRITRRRCRSFMPGIAAFVTVSFATIHLRDFDQLCSRPSSTTCTAEGKVTGGHRDTLKSVWGPLPKDLRWESRSWNCRSFRSL